MQVLHQAARLADGGSLPAARSGYGRLPYVQSMATIAAQVLPGAVMRHLGGGSTAAPAPHKTDKQVWAKRPL